MLPEGSEDLRNGPEKKGPRKEPGFTPLQGSHLPVSRKNDPYQTVPPWQYKPTP